MSFSLKLRLLNPSKYTQCSGHSYYIEKNSVKLYRVCIDDNTYMVYDLIFDDPRSREKIKDLEDKLYDLIVNEEPILEPEKLYKIGDPILRHIVERQLFGYGVLEPLFIDDNVINIHIVMGKPVHIIHRLAGRLTTNITLSNDEIKELAMRLSTAAGKMLSEATPLTCFIEPQYEARVTIVYVSDVTLRKGMAIDIRKPPEKPWTILKLLKLGSLSIEEAAFLWLTVKHRVPIMIVGEIMTGKTTLATALLALVPPGSRVLTIEDAPEIRIPTPYWIRTTVRDSGTYTVSVFDLLKTGVRLSVDYIVVGEIRGEEAREWAHAVLLGHGTITTFHAESPEAAIIRLLSPPISIDPQVMRLLNVFVKSNTIEKEPGRVVFRHEVYINEEGHIYPLFMYDSVTDRIILNPDLRHPVEDPKFVDRIALAHRITRTDLVREYEIMKKILAEIYNESLLADPSLDRPTYKELAEILYSKLHRELAAHIEQKMGMLRQ